MDGLNERCFETGGEGDEEKEKTFRDRLIEENIGALMSSYEHFCLIYSKRRTEAELRRVLDHLLQCVCHDSYVEDVEYM